MDSVLAPDIFNHVPKELVGFLEDHLPYSIPLLRRLQYAGFAHGDGWTSSSRVIVSPSLNSLEHTTNANFAAAFFDLSTGTETHMWMYSTTEDIDNRGDPAGSGSGNSADGEDNIVAIIDGAIDIQVQMANTTSTTTPPPTTIIVGSLHKKTRSIIERRTSRIVPYPGEETTVYYYDKWLMDVKSLPTATQQLPPGMRWDTATLSDCEIAAAKIPYPRLPTTLLAMPNVVIRLENGTPVVWGFLARDGSLTGLHCEEQYRRRGLAKILVSKLFRNSSSKYGSDGWCVADVAADNLSSTALCNSLGGTPRWAVSWCLLDITDKAVASGN